MQAFALFQAIVLQPESNIVAVDTDCQSDTAGQVILVIHNVTSADGRKTVVAGNGGINHRRSLYRVKGKFIGIGNNIKQIRQIFFSKFFIFIHHPGISAFAAQAQPNLPGAVDGNFLDVFLVIPVSQGTKNRFQNLKTHCLNSLEQLRNAVIGIIAAAGVAARGCRSRSGGCGERRRRRRGCPGGRAGNQRRRIIGFLAGIRRLAVINQCRRSAGGFNVYILRFINNAAGTGRSSLGLAEAAAVLFKLTLTGGLRVINKDVFLAQTAQFLRVRIQRSTFG